MEDKNKNLGKGEIIIKAKDIADDNGLYKNESQGDKIKFNKDLADQEWVNEKNYLRMHITGACGDFPFKPFIVDTVMLGAIAHKNRPYFFNQDKFIKTWLFGNRLFSIDSSFVNNVDFMQMFSQKYFIEPFTPRYSFFGAIYQSIRYNVYVYAMFEKKLVNNKEVKRFIAESDILNYITWINDQNKGLNSGNVSLDDRKKFDDIVNDFFNLPDSFMQCVVELFLKHKNYVNTFYLQGPTNCHLNCNCRRHNVFAWEQDHYRNGDLCDFTEKANSRRWETLSYYSRHMILCFFRPEYLFSDKKPDPKLVEFYVALNSLLSVREKENAKAILNTDNTKLNTQQQEMKKKLSGENEKFRNNIINAWKDGFFLDENKIKKSYDRLDEKNKTHNLFEDKEKKFQDDFNKINKDDLKSRCFIYDEKNGFVKIIDWLISEIENDNLTLMQQENNLKGDLSSINNDNEKVDFLVTQLFSGTHIADKDNMTHLKFSDEERNKYSKSDLQEKLKLIDNKIQFCPKAAKILKPSDCVDSVGEHYSYDYLKKEKLSELLYFENDKQKRDYIYLRENKDYYRDYVLHQDYGENELYNKLYQCTQKADFGKYKREHFIFDKKGTIIGMDVFAYFADEIASGELILKNKEGKDISDEMKKIDNDLAKEVFLMDKLKNDGYSVHDGENNRIGMIFDDMENRFTITRNLESTIQYLRTVEKDEKGNKKYLANEVAIDSLFNDLSSNNEKYKTIKDFIEMFRLEKEDIRKIVEATNKKTHALIFRYALNKIFAERIKPVNSKGKNLIGSYVFDFSQVGCTRDYLVFSKDGRVEYVKSESLPRVLKLDETKTLELQTRNNFIKDCKYDASDDKKLQEAKNKYKGYKVNEEDSDAAKNELKDLRANLSSDACANLSDFYDFDSYRDEFLDAYIKFYQDAEIDYEYWCSECAQKFLKDIKEKKEKSDDEIADIELEFFKGQKINQEDLSQYTKNNKQHDIEEIKKEIELEKFRNNKLKYENLSQNTRDTKKDEITEIELEKFRNNKLKYENLSQNTRDTKKNEITKIEDKLFGDKKFYNLSLEKQNKNQAAITSSEFDLLKSSRLRYDDLSQVTQTNLNLQQQESKLYKLKRRLEQNIILQTDRNNRNNLQLIHIDGEYVHYNSTKVNNQQLGNTINDLKVNILDLYKSKNIPYKHWDSDTKGAYYNELQWKWFKIGCVPLAILILSITSFFLPFIEGYLVIKIFFTIGSFICGCLVVRKKIKNDQNRDYEGPDTYDNPDYCYTENNFNEVPGGVTIPEINKNQNVFSPTSTASTSEITTNSSSSSTESEREYIPKSGFNNANQNQIKVGPSDH